MIYLSIAIFLGFLIVDLPKLIREKKRADLVVYCVLSGITLLYLVLFSLGKDIFSPIRWLSRFVETNLGLSYAIWQGHG